jgi:aldehyde:ferredoxin oxidoreductase
MVKDFYAAMGWDEEGFPTPEKLKELDLDLKEEKVINERE